MSRNFPCAPKSIHCFEHALQIEYICVARACDKRVFCKECVSKTSLPQCELTPYKEFFLQETTPELKEKLQEAESMSSQTQKYSQFLKQFDSCIDQLRSQFLANLLSLQEQIKNKILQTHPNLPALDQYQHFKRKLVESEDGLTSLDASRLKFRIEDIMENKTNLLRALEDFNCTEEGISDLSHVQVGIPYEKVNLLTSTVCSQVNDFFNGVAGELTLQIAKSPNRKIARNQMILSARGTPTPSYRQVPHTYNKLLSGDMRRLHTNLTVEGDNTIKDTIESAKYSTNTVPNTMYNDVDNIEFSPLSYRSGVRSDDGNIYWGQWKDGKKHGKGKQFYKDGRCYEGYWRENVPHGIGKMMHPDKDHYEGKWKNGKAHGYGTYVSHKGWNYEGEWVEDKIEGRGEQKYASGDVYQGEFKNGLRHGKGMLKFADGEIYRGDFADGMFNGAGEYIYKDTSRYQGEWRNNKRNGRGILYKDKINYEGNWKNDRLEGEVSVKSRTGLEHVIDMNPRRGGISKSSLADTLI